MHLYAQVDLHRPLASLTFNQRVEGSNPSAPTRETLGFLGVWEKVKIPRVYAGYTLKNVYRVEKILLRKESLYVKKVSSGRSC